MELVIKHADTAAEGEVGDLALKDVESGRENGIQRKGQSDLKQQERNPNKEKDQDTWWL